MEIDRRLDRGGGARRAGVLLLLLLSACRSGPDPSDPRSIFDHTVRTVERQFVFPERLDAAWRTRVDEARLRIGRDTSDEDLAAELDRLVVSLGASHTRFFHRDDPTAWGLRNVFAGEIDAYPRPSIGVWPVPEKWTGTRVRDVVDGSPAARAGLVPGDRIVAVDGRPFHPVRAFPAPGSYELVVERTNFDTGPPLRTTFRVEAIERSLQRHHLEGMRASARLVERSGVRVASIHLWSGTHEAFREELAAFAARAAREADAFILDLRGGFGGAHPGFLDPFFPVTAGHGPPTPAVFAGPMVALIDGGTRSGKEWLAHELHTRGRATLVGTRTAGAFLGGRWIPIVPGRFWLFLATIRGPEGLDLEGRGVPPDIEVRPRARGPWQDAAWERAVAEAVRLTREALDP